MNDKLKIKSLTKSQIIISVDRLTRFKPTEEKYLRVFCDIISSNLISPKYKKQDLLDMEYETLTNLVEQIFNASFENLNIPLSGNFSINQKLLDNENSVFKFDKKVEKLLKNKIDYNCAIKLFDEKIPLNLKWLKTLQQCDNQIESRENFGLKFPIEKVLIAEGITEEILLPKFARVLNADFDKSGVYLISAGGKNQVVKLFYKYAEVLKLPIFVLLDNDATENYEEIKPKLRKSDKVYVIERGEFEDLLPIQLIKRTLNRRFKNYFSVRLNELRAPLPMTKILSELYKSHGLEFKKAEFATLVGENIENLSDASEEIDQIILNI